MLGVGCYLVSPVASVLTVTGLCEDEGALCSGHPGGPGHCGEEELPRPPGASLAAVNSLNLHQPAFTCNYLSSTAPSFLYFLPPDFTFSFGPRF